jgi:hypothetical protein
MTDPFLDLFDTLTVREDWKPIRRFPGWRITSDGRVEGSRGKLLKRYISITCHKGGDYDELMKTVVFDSDQEWVDIPLTSHKVHIRGVIRSKETNEFMGVFVNIRSKRIPIHLLIEETFHELTDRLCYNNYTSLKERYTPRLTFETLMTTNPIFRSGLLCIRDPDFLERWLDISEVGNISAGSSTTRKIRCIIHEDEVIIAPMNDIISGVRKCKQCLLNPKERSQVARTVTEKAFELEHSMFALILETAGPRLSDKIGDREIIGNSKEDYVMTLASDNSKRCSQFKMLDWMESTRQFKFCLQKGYPVNMPIIGSNNEKTLFFLAMRCDLPLDEADKPRRSITGYHDRSCVYSKYCFTDKEIFVDNLLVMLQNAIQEYELDASGIRYSKTEQKAIEMIQWLRDLLSNNGIQFKGRTTGSDMGIDGYTELLDGLCRKSAQLKYTSVKSGLKYPCNLARTSQQIHVPYSITDNIDVFIFKIEGYENDVLIIPGDAMVKQGLVATPSQPGRKGVSLPPPDYNKPSWMSQFWNRFDLLKCDNFVHKVNGFLKVIADYEELGYTVEFNTDTFQDKEIVVNSRRIRIVITSASSGEFTLVHRSNGIGRPFNVTDGIEGFVFILSNGDRYFIPTPALVYTEHVTNDSKPGKHCIAINGNPWFNQFKEKIESMFMVWIQENDNEPPLKRFARLIVEAGYQATDHHERTQQWLTVNDRRVNVSFTRQQNVKPIFALNYTTHPFAFILYYIDDPNKEFYVILASDLAVYGKGHVTVGVNWNLYKNNIRILEPIRSV